MFPEEFFYIYRFNFDQEAAGNLSCSTPGGRFGGAGSVVSPPAPKEQRPNPLMKVLFSGIGSSPFRTQGAKFKVYIPY
jgi:hypothetical protein